MGEQIAVFGGPIFSRMGSGTFGMKRRVVWGVGFRDPHTGFLSRDRLADEKNGPNV